MKKAKSNHVPGNNSKISDFFTKTINNDIPENKVCDNKRKISEVQSLENPVLSSVTNLPLKNNQNTSPNRCKKPKHDENFVSGAISPGVSIKPSSSMRTPTPKKNSCSLANKRSTPNGSRKGTPSKKLFDKSPRKLEEFNVQILEKFVKVSPSTSNKIVKIKNTPNKLWSVESTIVDHKSPSSSERFAQNYKTTPTKSPHYTRTESPRVRAKLKFSENMDKVNIQGNQIFEKMTNNVENKLNDDLDRAFENLFTEDFDILEEANMNQLSFEEAQYCKILEAEKSGERNILKLESISNGEIGMCYVENFWSFGNHFKTGNKIYISAGKNSEDKWVVNNKVGWLVFEPDLLISCTSVVGSLFCKRKSVLAERYRGFDSGNRVMLIGILVHTLLQSVLKEKLKSTEEIEIKLKNILNTESTVKKLYENNLTFSDIESELQSFVPRIMKFVNQYVYGSSNPEQNKNWKGKICSIEDIEENLWCPELGIKGKIDVTIRSESDTMPLELKTGRATVSLEHRGQVMLYIMMMNKFGYQVSSGLLLYLREGVLKEIKITPQEKRDLMILRNELAYFLTRNVRKSGSDGKLAPPELPEPINHHSACSKCPYNIICTSYLKFDNYDLSENKPLQEVQNNVTAHLTESHLNYFIHWTTLLSMEEECSSGSKNLQEIYTVEPEKREKQGRCIINVKVVFVGTECNGLFEHTFEKENSDNAVSFIAYGILESNYVVVSSKTRPAVAAGFVTDICSSSVTIALDRNLNMKYGGTLFHLDTYDSNTTQTFNLTSLALLLEDTSRAAELRDIIIDKKPPTFVSKLPSVVAKKGAPILRRLNHVQQKAVLKALCAKEFLLIKGMPGTGKTATIVALIQLLVELNKTVLITSHTHSAVDNICTRLQKFGVDFIRLGSESRIHQNLKSKCEANLIKGCTTPEQLEEVYNSYKVIAVTCLGSGHPLLSRRTVDFCIIDESTQVLQSSVIKPLYAAKTFILIGDPDQLAPVVRNRDAINAGMSESLFERLNYSDGTITLNLNYRMNRIITDLANVFTYKGELKPANEVVATSSLQIPNIELIKSTYQEHSWLLRALDTSLEASVQIIDTGPVWKLSQDVWSLKKSELGGNSDSQNCINIYEAAIVATLVNALIKGGVSNADIGVIATYRAQVAQISAILSKTNVDVSTVDQFQGRDKCVIIYSCAKSKDMSKTNSDYQKFELLEDKRRLTVAITRAKHKLLLVGDTSTLHNYSTLSVILAAVNKNNIIKFDSEWTTINNF